MLRVMNPKAKPPLPPQVPEGPPDAQVPPADPQAGGVPPELAALMAQGGPPDAGSPDAPPEPKKSKLSIDLVDPDVAGYMGSELGPFECGRCEFWKDPNACAIVSGPIDPRGCCNLFTPTDHGDETVDSEADSQEPSKDVEDPNEAPPEKV